MMRMGKTFEDKNLKSLLWVGPWGAALDWGAEHSPELWEALGHLLVLPAKGSLPSSLPLCPVYPENLKTEHHLEGVSVLLSLQADDCAVRKEALVNCCGWSFSYVHFGCV
jgi:hypothetical protein